ncbi:GNAT family N-acetyltransferase [Chlorogloea sp. CCALA 695]|uniref:GNAT family N-acetyltransferase n=1 Tax=Chlorogloea sp. CCALA 695 TaxID=2107693 RepID=UPI000D07F010|nr:N-acetyltransferase [Chlorogloea sp. CCALA 695]PSB29216.1 GNAT family N-acetyltransferase [Chlorogloea sp. CCALA 695]
MSTEVICLEISQIDAASKTLAHAFNDDPIFRHFASEREQARLGAIQLLAKTALRYSQSYNHIYTTAKELKGVAIWIPPGKFPLNDLRLLRLGLYTLPFKLRLNRLRQLISLFLTMEKHHKQDITQPHWYLFMLGVSPTYQRQGIGNLLLQPILKQADSEKLSCYLETSTEGGVRFYQRLGFEVVRTGGLPEADFKFWTMKRSPQS